jgi:hypothetical protein
MKLNPILLATALLFLSFSSSGQADLKYDLFLKNGSFSPSKNITADKIDELNRKTPKADGKSFLIIQFEKIPSQADRSQLQQAGIELLDYVPNNAYTATVSGSLNAALLEKVKARAVITLTPEQKMQPTLSKGIYPPWAVKVGGTVDAWISFPKTFSFETVINELKARNIDIVSVVYKEYRVISLRIATGRLNELAALPFIEYVQAAPKEDQTLNNKSRVIARANILNSSLPGGRNLQGDGVVVGVGDDSDPMRHIDFIKRLINRFPQSGGFHGVHVMGTVGAAGIIEEKYKGYAPKSIIIKQFLSGIIVNAPVYVQDYGMVISNNSYGTIEDDCTAFGIYDLSSRIMDLQSYQLPNLQTVFAAGNSGAFICGPYTSGFGTVLGSYQTSKNVLDVAAVTELGAIASFSSKGPVRDGRIKPEIAALGRAMFSTWPINDYHSNQGTSMAAPGVSGGLALLYQRYRQMHGNANPKNGLMKALLCNGANDAGNAGPDYTFGFGSMNLLRSVQMLENVNYVNDSAATGDSNAHSITIPANTAQLKVMLYWNDPAAAVLASHALVNDLDLEVKDPSLVTSLPQRLDTLPLNVNVAATTGVDHINNIEQVVINNPAAGPYTISVKGTAVVQNPRQEYFIVYDVLPVSATLTYPIGGERLAKADSIYISWDAYGNTVNDFTVQRSMDNGASWSTVPNGANVAAGLSQLKWFVPDTAITHARIKLIHNGTGLESISDTFTIIGVPIDSLLPNQCEGYISIGWKPVTGATDYELMMLRGDEMVPVATTTGNSYHFTGLSKDSVYWVAVRARLNGVPGRRSFGLSRQPAGNGTCTGTFTANDLKIDALIAPSSGRELTSSALSASTIIRVRVKNLDNTNAATSYNVKYSVNGSGFVSEPVVVALAANDTATHNFAATYDFSPTGSYIVRVVVENTSAIDPVSANDTMTVIIKQLPNVQITLTIGNDFLDDIETATDSSYYRGQIGLDGADRYDFTSSTVFGRVRPFVNSGIAYSGNKALTLDADRFNGGGTADSLKATFNLLPHFNTADDIRLDFVYKNHNQGPDNANKVWIRGDDAKPWIEAYDLFNNQAEPNSSFKKTSSIELSDILSANSQDFSTSFQLRFGQQGFNIAADNEGGAGYTFDDIHLYKVDNDIQMISIDTPVVASCGLSNAVPVRVTIGNSADTTVNSIPVKFSVDGGTPVVDNLASITGNTNISFSFAGSADLSVTGTHIVKVWVDYPFDSFRGNDTVTITVINSEIISSFPYLQNFESNDGGWYSRGKNDSWEYGTPSSTKVNRAASGAKAWKTNLTGSYKDQQLSYLYSPCFNITGMTNPTLSLSIALDLEDCGPDLCDGAYMEYSPDGITWTRLGAYGQGTNWYNKNFTNPNKDVWSEQDYTNWHVATIPLPAGYSQLRLRFVIASDPFVNREGIAVDDIHIYDNVYGIYSGPPYTSNTINQAVSGSNWIHFTDGGKLIASVNPNGQNLGSTNARVYINTLAVRTNGGQYYHDRNITIKPPDIHPADSATVRFYFLDTETENLINATGCPGCTKPSMAYQLGVSKYSDADTAKENGTIADNALGSWLFINSGQAVKVPFDKGYYAEFKVKDFSEFWLNNGGLSNNQSLPVELLSFTAKKGANRKDVLTEWVTASELNTGRFELELARSNEAFQQNNFIRIGTVNSHGNSSSEQRYSFTDIESNKSGVRYYRLKIVDVDGRFTYSAVRPVVFNDEVKWQVYPNPSEGLFNLVYQMNEGENIQVKLFDINGKLVQQTRLAANGFIQKHSMNLQSPQFASGLYLLEVTAGENKQVFRLIKQ